MDVRMDCDVYKVMDGMKVYIILIPSNPFSAQKALLVHFSTVICIILKRMKNL